MPTPAVKSVRLMVFVGLVLAGCIWRFTIYTPLLDQAMGPEGVMGSVYAQNGPMGIAMQYRPNDPHPGSSPARAVILVYRDGEYRAIGQIEADSRFSVALKPGNYTFVVKGNGSEMPFTGSVAVAAGQWSTFDIHLQHDHAHDHLVY